MKNQSSADEWPAQAGPPDGEKAPETGPRTACRTAPVTVIIPAYNESATISETIMSLRNQILAPAEIVVVDDGSTDATGDVARSLGVTVLRPPARTGSKAGAQTFALGKVKTEFTIAIDADTTLAPDAISRLCPAFADPAVAAACGSVLPRRIQTVWERGRYVEYLFAFTFYKRIQDQYGAPLISSGCFSMYRTAALREVGGWPNRTLAEDMDLTWTFYKKGYAVRFVPGAICYPLEPHSYGFLKRQLRRWSHGFVQNVRLHRRDILDVPFLRSAVAVACWDAVVASLVYLLILPLAAIIFSKAYFLLGYVIDIPAIVVPVVVGATLRREIGRALISIPSFFVLRTVNAVFFLMAVWSEFVRRRTYLVYEKGH